MRKFDTKIQYHKYKILREITKLAFEDRLMDCYTEIPDVIIKGPESITRCCIYKEKAILSERIKLALGGNKKNPNVIEVIEIACDECPVSGYNVINDLCRGCMAHRCEDACMKHAISFDKDNKAIINKENCIECGRCAAVCPYGAISNSKRPCERACKINAIKRGKDNCAEIDNNKCISCGACAYQCPFGAIADKSYILEVIEMIKANTGNLYAVVAPSVSSQFSYAKLGQVISGIKELGFNYVVEAALGADMVAYKEATELAEKKFLTSSCCPAFVDYIHKHVPDMTEHISSNLSPMAEVSRYLKEKDPQAKIVFIGPCTAKKMEFRKEEVKPYVDSVITFEELQALLDGREIDITQLEETSLDDASYYGRIFARSGGVSDAVRQALFEHNMTEFSYDPIICDGIEACRSALLRASKHVLHNNFIEGMACSGGCIGGAGCLTHGVKDKNLVDKYGHLAAEKTISSSVHSVEKTKE